MTRLPKGTLIAGFPGIGKTTASAYPRVLDLESSEYLFELPDRPLTRLEIESYWKGCPDRVPVPNGHELYAEAAKAALNSGDYDYVLISVSPQVLDAMRAAGLNPVRVGPVEGLEDEYYERYRGRGNTEDWARSTVGVFRFLKDWTDEDVRLGAGEYLSDILEL